MSENFTKVSPAVLEDNIPESKLDLITLGDYITGLELSIDTDSDHDIDIAAGRNLDPPVRTNVVVHVR